MQVANVNMVLANHSQQVVVWELPLLSSSTVFQGVGMKCRLRSRTSNMPLNKRSAKWKRSRLHYWVAVKELKLGYLDSNPD